MKTVLITGASSGIGLDLARGYAIDGWKVFACGRRVDELNYLAKQFQEISVLTFDVTNKAECEAVLSAINLPLDLIILNAGNCEYVEQGHVDSAVFKRMFDVNFFGMLYCIEALQSGFTARTHLALMGSSAAYLPFPRAEAYGASKAAVAYFANSLAVDLRQKGMTVSLISPGFVQTPLTAKNTFSMPMAVSSDSAATKIRQGLLRQKSEIHFPKKFTYCLKFIALLPINWQRKLMAHLSRNRQ